MGRAAAAAPARFTGFADSSGRFFQALAQNQRREWFATHRDEYEQGWLAPMRALLAEVRARLEPLFPDEELGPPKIFRIHRDVRFSKDKSPYKTHIGGYVSVGGGAGGPTGAAVPYVHIGVGELFVAAGQYMMDPAQLADFRAAVADEERGAALDAILRTLRRAGYGVGSQHQLQRVPRGCDPAHPRADLLKRKGLIVTFPAPPRRLLVSPKLVGWLVTHTRRTVPLIEWLAAVSM